MQDLGAEQCVLARTLEPARGAEMEEMETPKRQLSLLLVDDDAELCGMMKEYFAQAGHRLECAHNGRDGLARAMSGGHDLIILDVMLPVMDGFTMLHQRGGEEKYSRNHADSAGAAAGPDPGAECGSR